MALRNISKGEYIIRYGEIIRYAERLQKKGLHLMDLPGHDGEVVTSMIAGGAQIALFSTGRGTPTGFPFVPVIKITGNSTTYKKMVDNMDINAGEIVDANKSIDVVGREILNEIIEVASGKLTKAEILKHDELFCINRL